MHCVGNQKYSGGWNDEEIYALASLPVEEYRKAFKATSGAQLRKMLSGVFQFDRITNASNAMREISKRGRLALKIIGAESSINKRRASRFGIKVDDANAPPPGDSAPAK
jgi:hypothetical protein